MREICVISGLIPLIPEVLSRSPTAAAATAASPGTADYGAAAVSVNSSSSKTMDGVREPAMPEIPVVDVLSNLSSRDSDDDDSPGRNGEGSAACKDSDLEKAQSCMAWVVAALATEKDTRWVADNDTHHQFDTSSSVIAYLIMTTA